MADPDYNVVTGTAWTFTSKHAAETPVDVLLVDEAGQLALIDAVVASTNADSVVLLGDPQQLPHVAVASHPYRALRVRSVICSATTSPFLLTSAFSSNRPGGCTPTSVNSSLIASMKVASPVTHTAQTEPPTPALASAGFKPLTRSLDRSS